MSLLAGCSDTLDELETESPEYDGPVRVTHPPLDEETATTSPAEGETDNSRPQSKSDDPETPIHLAKLSGGTAPDLDVENPEVEDRIYTQDIAGYGETELRLSIPTDLYNYYDSRTRDRRSTAGSLTGWRRLVQRRSRPTAPGYAAR